MTATYTVVLDTQPTESVTVTPSRSSGDPDVTVSGALTFTTSNWSEPQTVTVSARQDADAADDRAVIGHEVSGGDYASVSADSVTVTVDDDETPSTGVTLTLSPEKVREDADADHGDRDGQVERRRAAGGDADNGQRGFGDRRLGHGLHRDIRLRHRHRGEQSLRDRHIQPGAGGRQYRRSRTRPLRVTGSTTVAGLTVRGASIEIEDNDASPTVTLSLSDTSIGENGGTTTVTARLDRASGAATTVTISATPVSPAM